ncbi:MAG TPA: carbohydrate porin [Usitatibacter sp.]|jgi:porin|nr:carbohydrate porin [Usitatibacter sp.]
MRAFPAGHLAAIACALAAGGARAQSDSDAPAVSSGLLYDGGAFARLGGGLSGGSTYTSDAHITLEVDAGKLGWAPDTIAHLDVLSLNGGNPSKWIGDAQGVSSIAGSNGTRIYELWAQKNLFGNRASVLLGLYDLNTEFYRLQTASLFMNGSFGVGPEFSKSGVDGPSIFPDTSVGARIALKPYDNTVLRLAILDGAPVHGASHDPLAGGEGALFVAEAAFLDRAKVSVRPSTGRQMIGRDARLGEYDSKAAFGAWHYTARFPDASDIDAAGNPVMRKGSTGAYALYDRMLYRARETGPRVDGFLEAAVGDGRVNRFGSYFGAGLSIGSMFASRSNDTAGLAVAHARNGSHYMDAQVVIDPGVTRAETTIESTYLAQVSKHFAIQPDLQYVIHPNTTSAIPNAWALQVRFEVQF